MARNTTVFPYKNRPRQHWLQTRHLFCQQPTKAATAANQAGAPQPVVDWLEMSDVAADVAAVAAFLAADTTDVLSAAKAAPEVLAREIIEKHVVSLGFSRWGRGRLRKHWEVCTET